MTHHDPVAVTNAFATKLATASRHVCVLLGAGASCAAKLPDMVKLRQLVLDGLPGADRATVEKLFGGRNLELGLSRLRQVQAILDPMEDFLGITSAKAGDLDALICRIIAESVSVELATLDAFAEFAAWVVGCRYQRPLEVFTTNYDVLIESAFEMEGVPYFDGFVGALNAPFRSDLVDNQELLAPLFVRLWKLHGSVNWRTEAVGKGTRVLRSPGAPPGHPNVAIYPSNRKYEESRRLPFTVLLDRFRNALRDPETVVIVSGYSFSDEHLNEVIMGAAAEMPRNDFNLFFYSSAPPHVHAAAARFKNISVFERANACIGGTTGAWQPTAGDSLGVYEKNEFLLGDFHRLSSFLAKTRNNQP